MKIPSNGSCETFSGACIGRPDILDQKEPELMNIEFLDKDIQHFITFTREKICKLMEIIETNILFLTMERE